MTEDEAKTKWCPMIRWPHIDQEQVAAAAVNIGIYGETKNFQCKGSDCMMWRISIDEMRSKHKKPSGEAEEYRYIDGYCGLAGKPL